jgi:hypothetical protein
MTADMATEKRLRVSFDAESEEVRRAIRIAAAMTGQDADDILNGLVKTHLAKYVELARQAIAEDEPAPRKKRTS